MQPFGPRILLLAVLFGGSFSLAVRADSAPSELQALAPESHQDLDALLFGTQPRRGHFYFGLGVFSQNLGKTTASETGKSSLIGQLYFPAITFETRLKFGERLGIMPGLAVTPLAKEGYDGVTKRIYYATFPFIWDQESDFEFKFGPGLMLYTVGGPGGTVQVNNGTGTTTATLPSQTRSSWMFLLEFGIAQKMKYDFRAEIDVLVADAIVSNRSFNVVYRISKGFL